MQSAESITADMAGAKYFSKLDASSGNWQIKVDDESSKLLAFNTLFRRYKFKRLPFVILSASEVFQKKISQIIEGINGCANVQDDIIVWGKTKHEHDLRLAETLDRINKSEEKCRNSFEMMTTVCSEDRSQWNKKLTTTDQRKNIRRFNKDQQFECRKIAHGKSKQESFDANNIQDPIRYKLKKERYYDGTEEIYFKPRNHLLQSNRKSSHRNNLQAWQRKALKPQPSLINPYPLQQRPVKTTRLLSTEQDQDVW